MFFLMGSRCSCCCCCCGTFCRWVTRQLPSPADRRIIGLILRSRWQRSSSCSSQAAQLTGQLKAFASGRSWQRMMEQRLPGGSQTQTDNIRPSRNDGIMILGGDHQTRSDHHHRTGHPSTSVRTALMESDSSNGGSVFLCIQPAAGWLLAAASFLIGVIKISSAAAAALSPTRIEMSASIRVQLLFPRDQRTSPAIPHHRFDWNSRNVRHFIFRWTGKTMLSVCAHDHMQIIVITTASGSEDMAIYCVFISAISNDAL